MTDRPLSAKHSAFIAEYRSDRNASRAYSAVYGAKGNSAEVSASQLLRNPKVAAEVARLDAEHAERLDIDLSRVLLDAWGVLTADPRELVELRVGACRYCYGEGHRWQRTVAEFNADFERWTEKLHKPAEEFDAKGGIGFDPRKPPADDCPECFGSGAPQEVFKDVRHVSPAAALLYAGIKRTKEGMTLLLRDKDAARETLMKHLGGYLKDNEQKRTPLAEALGGFMAQIHQDEAGKLQHVPGLRVVPGGKKAA